jgi:hypothetical protein
MGDQHMQHFAGHLILTFQTTLLSEHSSLASAGSAVTESATIVTAFAAAAMVWISWLLLKSNRIANRIAVGQSMPILNFRVDQNESPAWIVENVGKGVALNVLLAHVRPDGKVDEPLRDYNTLRPGMKYKIRWMPRPYKFVAQFTDVYGHCYSAVCERNKNSLHEKWLYQGWANLKNKPFWRMVVSGEVVTNGSKGSALPATASQRVSPESASDAEPGQASAQSWTE